MISNQQANRGSVEVRYPVPSIDVNKLPKIELEYINEGQETIEITVSNKHWKRVE